MAPPVVYGMPPPTVVYGVSSGHHHGHGHHGYDRHHRGDGGDGASMAMGIGGGVLGGMILGDVLFD